MKQHFIFLLLCSLFLFSCKKKKEATPSTLKTYLKSYTEGNSNRQFNYDNLNRFSSIVYNESGLTQSFEINRYDNIGNITEYTIRTTGTTQVTNINIFYDTQNRINYTERRDSATNTINQIISYSYTTSTTVRETKNGAGLLLNRNVYTYNTNGNIIKKENYNNIGTLLQTYTYGDYDNKLSPETLVPLLYRNGEFHNNNYRTYTVTNHSTGISNSYTVTYTYNTEGYPTQQIFNTSPIYTYNYIYEKK